MKICFILPQILRKPVGGYKIVYEYANRLSDKGHKVDILFLNENALCRFRFPQFVKKYLIFLLTKTEPGWFRLNSNIKKWSSTENKLEKKLSDTDLAIATGADTVEFTLRFFRFSKKAYLIQDYESWISDEKTLHETYASGMDNIVISNWLKKIVDQYSKKEALLIRNPIDVNRYKATVAVEERDACTIGVLYHTAEHKGFKDAYKAIFRLKGLFPDLKVNMFGTLKPTNKLPDWIDFKLNATQAETVSIYNKISVFLCATVKEGYGLTGLEAMACGAVLVSTEYEGVREYAVNGYNALLSPVHDVDFLVKNVSELILNETKRFELAKNGIDSVKRLSWESAMELFDQYLETVKAG